MQRHIMLFWESKLIHKLRGKTFVPFLHFVGDEKTEDGKMYHVMVMDLLGKSLEDLFQECRRKFDLKTVLHISCQMVSYHLYLRASHTTKMMSNLNVFIYLHFLDLTHSESPRREDYPPRH